MDKLVDLSTELENKNVHAIENTYVDIDELNDILSTSEYTEVDKDDEINQLQFNKEDDGHAND
jgi:hypothetical protein